jgi:hypothetical protein
MRDRIFFYDQDRHRFLDIVKGGRQKKRKRQGFQEIGWRTEGELLSVKLRFDPKCYLPESYEQTCQGSQMETGEEPGDRL